VILTTSARPDELLLAPPFRVAGIAAATMASHVTGMAVAVAGCTAGTGQCTADLHDTGVATVGAGATDFLADELTASLLP
jgi:hypothetical protein